MKLLTADARLVCQHRLGRVENRASQRWVTVAGRPLLVATDPEGRPIDGCPNINVGILPCKATLKVKQGYSAFVAVDGHRVCLDSVEGLTTGTPAGFVKYVVDDPGQRLVSGDR